MANDERVYAARNEFMPMTDEVRAIIRRELAEAGWVSTVSLGAVLFGAVAAILLWGSGPTPQGRGLVAIFLMLVGFAGLLALSYRGQVFALLRDLRATHYCRDRGVATADEKWDDGYFYEVSINGSRLKSPWGGTRRRAPFSKIDDAIVDYTSHARLILAIRDVKGWDAYRLAGYHESLK